MIEISYKPKTNTGSQFFLGKLALVFDPIDEIRKEELRKSRGAGEPAGGGAIEEIVSNPVNWQIAIGTAQLIGLIVQIYLTTISLRAHKRLDFNFNNCEKVNINFNNYATSDDLKTDLKKKFPKDQK